MKKKYEKVSLEIFFNNEQDCICGSGLNDGFFELDEIEFE